MLLLARHGEAEANRASLLLGRSDSPLTEKGRAQALRIADALLKAGEVPEVIISSPLTRALESAELIAYAIEERLEKKPRLEVDDRWIELDYGNLEGLRIDKVPASLWRKWRLDPDFAPLGGESLTEVQQRVEKALEELARPALRHHVLVVSHVSPIKAAVCWALRVDPTLTWSLHLRTGAITRIRTSSPPALVSFGEVIHLGAE